ncbi:hypothetical protein VNI00_002981 [Paramarasmius palmivorus]|uniref:Uncharacterized protein n=1 Tax=Paramarasmius palmivorus TaxID=297713 RepID=A0AAW0DZP6_9AGAR
MSAPVLDPTFTFPSSIPVVSGQRARTKTTATCGSASTSTSNWIVHNHMKGGKTQTLENGEENCRTDQKKPQRRSVQVQQRAPSGYSTLPRRQNRSTQPSTPSTTDSFGGAATASLITTLSSSAPQTMQTRVAIRDKSPHRFQVVPLKEAKPKLTEKKEIEWKDLAKPHKKTNENTVDAPKRGHLSVATSQAHSTKASSRDTDGTYQSHLNTRPLALSKFPSDSSFTTSRPKASRDGHAYVDLATSLATPVSKQADSTTARRRTLSERDPNVPSAQGKVQHARSSTAKDASTTSRKAAVSSKGKTPRMTRRLGTMFARSIWSIPSSRKSESRQSPEVSGPIGSKTAPVSREPPSTENTKALHRHAAAYSLDILNRSNFLKFSSLRSNVAARHPHAKAIFLDTEKQDETAAMPKPEISEGQSSLKRHAIYSRALVVPMTKSPVAQDGPKHERKADSLSPLPVASRTPVSRVDSVESIVRVYSGQLSVVPSISSIPLVPALPTIIPLSCSRTSLSRSRSYSLGHVKDVKDTKSVNDTGSIRIHPIVAELIQAVDATIDSWRGVDSTLAVPRS